LRAEVAWTAGRQASTSITRSGRIIGQSTQVNRPIDYSR